MLQRVFILFLIYTVVTARRYKSRCALARELVKVGFPTDVFLGSWVCLIEKVNSNRDTALVTTNGSGKKSYGLYQIPEKWCKLGRPGGDCNIACESLIDDDITDDSICARAIFAQEGFKHWPIYLTRCAPGDLKKYAEEIYKCPGMTRLLKMNLF